MNANTTAETPEGIRPGLAWGLALCLALLFALGIMRMAFAQPPAVDPDHRFDTARVMATLGRILGDEAPHPVDSDASDAVIDRLVGEIEALGFAPEIDDAFHCSYYYFNTCARVRNVGFWVGAPGPDAIMLASHHDSVPTGPGAGDDGMGVAASLEIARLIRESGELPRPLYVLMTDGEEVGLIGASHFVANSPVAPMIGAVVSLEARGNAGIATMFETSAPNGRDLAALEELDVKVPLTSSMTVDIYRAMPNGTDVTEYLKLDIDAVNYSMVGRPWNYHTTRDDLAHLDPRSVFHNGASALAAVEGLMGVGPETSDAPRIYSDVAGLGVIALPAWTGLPGLVLVAVALGFGVVRLSRNSAYAPAGRAPLWALIALPVLILIAGPLAAFIANWVVLLIRPESAPGTAYPVALRATQMAAALTACAGLAAWLYRPGDADRQLQLGWIALILMGALITLVLPGGAILFLPSGALAALGALLMAFGLRRIGVAAFAAAAGLLLAMTLPMLAVAETSLFIESAWMFMPVVMAWVVATLPLFWRREGRARVPVLVALGATAVAFVAALVVPAYSEDAPLGRNIFHAEARSESDPANFSMNGRDPLPDGIAGEWTRVLGGMGERTMRHASPAPSPGLEAAVLEDVVVEGESIRATLRSPDADVLLLTIANAQAVSVNGQDLEVDPNRSSQVECAGRACRTLDLAIQLSDMTNPMVHVRTYAYGMNADADALLASLPPTENPQHNGHVRMRSDALYPLDGVK